MAHTEPAARLMMVLATLAALAVLNSARSYSQTVKPSAGSKPSGADTAAGPAAPRASKSDAENPFNRYLETAGAHRAEPALVRFAKNCGVDTGNIVPRFAERPRDRWRIVKDLSGALKDQAAEDFHTLEAWQAGKRVVTEEWGMEADSEDYYRIFICLENRRVTSVELVSWDIPDEEDSAEDPGWGYEIRWMPKPGGKFVRASTRFLDLREQPIAEPKLDPDEKRDLEGEDFQMRGWMDLGYPPALLK